MKGGVLASRLADRLEALADRARSIGADGAEKLLRGHAAIVRAAPRREAIRSVALFIRVSADRVRAGAAPAAIVSIWEEAARLAEHPQRHLAAARGGLDVMPPEQAAKVRAAASAALRAMPIEQRLAKARKAVETRRSRGKGNAGDRHPMRRLSSTKAREIRETWARWVAERPAGVKFQRGARSQGALADLYGVSRETVVKILAGRTWRAVDGAESSR